MLGFAEVYKNYENFFGNGHKPVEMYWGGHYGEKDHNMMAAYEHAPNAEHGLRTILQIASSILLYVCTDDNSDSLHCFLV